jgi:FtsH-binding integral membrane protein
MSDYDRNASARWGAGIARSRGAEIDQGLRAYMLGIYNHMTVGLAITALVALGANMLAVTPDRHLTAFGEAIYRGPLHFVVMLAPLGFVIYFSARIGQMTAASARSVFYFFAAAMGLSLSTILLVYTGQSIARSFFVTAAAFGGLSLYGYTTRKDLSGLASFLVMGLIGVIVAGLVNMFVQSTGMQFALSCLTVLIFSGFTAYDTQMLKESYYAGGDYETATKGSIFGALQLYLDFINIFLAVLNITGSRND